jgi:hypothetical protein
MPDIHKVIFILLFFINCAPFDFSGKFIGAPDFVGFEQLDSKEVTGSSCANFIFAFFPINMNVIGKAYKDALSKAPAGTTGLSDVTISYREFRFSYISLIYWNRCYTITGYPARRKISL